MYDTVKRLVLVAMSTPFRSDLRGDNGLVSLALAGVVLGEVVLCGIIITNIACEAFIQYGMLFTSTVIFIDYESM